MQIRHATRSDGQAVKELVFGILADFGLAPEPEGVDRDLDDLEGFYAARGGMFLVVEDADGRLIGSVGMAPHGPDTLELRKMYLAKAARGRGLGRELLARALAFARERGARRVFLETAAVLEDAVRMYERAGFRPVPPGSCSARCDMAYELLLAETKEETHARELQA